ncbi:MAG: hypothetical protein WC792_02470 [Candidatus Micrarchaeia archaeon]
MPPRAFPVKWVNSQLNRLDQRHELAVERVGRVQSIHEMPKPLPPAKGMRDEIYHSGHDILPMWDVHVTERHVELPFLKRFFKGSDGLYYAIVEPPENREDLAKFVTEKFGKGAKVHRGAEPMHFGPYMKSALAIPPEPPRDVHFATFEKKHMVAFLRAAKKAFDEKG